jgi:hypothetical protein
MLANYLSIVKNESIVNLMSSPPTAHTLTLIWPISRGIHNQFLDSEIAIWAGVEQTGSDTISELVQWLGFLAFTEAARVRFPDSEIFFAFYTSLVLWIGWMVLLYCCRVYQCLKYQMRLYFVDLMIDILHKERCTL